MQQLHGVCDGGVGLLCDFADFCSEASLRVAELMCDATAACIEGGRNRIVFEGQANEGGGSGRHRASTAIVRASEIGVSAG